MKENECNHYYQEKFRHGRYNERWFECVLCNAPPVLKAHNKLMNFREVAPANKWSKILKEAQKK